MKSPVTFKGVKSFLSRIPNINYGGCGISALAMYKWLQINKPELKVIFVYLHNRSDMSNYIRNQVVLKTKSGEPDAPCHACLCIDGKYFDCEKQIDLSEYKFVQHVEEEWFIVKSIRQSPHNLKWNTSFNREVNIPKIEKALNIKLNIDKRVRIKRSLYA